MKKLTNKQIKNLKYFWEEEYLPALKDKDEPVRVFFTGTTLEWLTWEYINSDECENLENPDLRFYFDTGDDYLTFDTFCVYAEDYINTGKVYTFYN